MKTLKVTLVLLVLACSALAQNGDVVSGIKAVNRHFRKHPLQKGAIISSGECAAGIAFSANPVGAAAVGLPILALGDLSALLLSRSKPVSKVPTVDVVTALHNSYGYLQRHPDKLQDIAGAFCLSYGLTRTGRTVAKTVKPTPQPTPDPPPSNPPPSNPPPVNPPPVNPPPVNPPPVNPPPTPQPPPHRPCIQDCGFSGNGGVNGGQDVNKPPFPGKGPKGQ